MFGLFKKECPVEENEKKWIEDSLTWFYSPSREIEFKVFDSINITSYFPSDNIALKEEHLYKIFEKVRKHLAFGEDLTCEVIIVEPDQLPLPEGLMLKPEFGDSVTCRGYISDGKFILEVSTKYMNSPFYIVSCVAYSLTFYKLKKEKALTEINGFVNELGSLVFGFGVFQANSVISQNKWSGVSHYGWSVGKRSFLTQQMIGYALAVTAYLKEENNPEWAKYLCRDVKAYFDRSNKFIKTNQDYFLKYKNEVKSTKTLSCPPDYIYIEQKYYPKGGCVRSVSEMKNGTLDGLTKYYHKNGVLWSEWEYKNNVPWNIFCSFNDRSEPVDKGTLVNGTGKMISYNEYGEIGFTQDFENGILKNTEYISDLPYYK